VRGSWASEARGEGWSLWTRVNLPDSGIYLPVVGICRRVYCKISGTCNAMQPVLTSSSRLSWEASKLAALAWLFLLCCVSECRHHLVRLVKRGVRSASPAPALFRRKNTIKPRNERPRGSQIGIRSFGARREGVEERTYRLPAR
jgi:hypothetical protein